MENYRCRRGTTLWRACRDIEACSTLTVLMHLFDEIEELDDVADDDANQADDTQEHHESEGSTHDDRREE